MAELKDILKGDEKIYYYFEKVDSNKKLIINKETEDRDGIQKSRTDTTKDW